MKALRRNHTTSSTSSSSKSLSSSPLLSSPSSSSSSSPFSRKHSRKKKHSSSSPLSSTSSWVHLRSVLFVVASSSSPSASSTSYPSDRSHLKSPWSRRRRKHILTSQLWRSAFTEEGKLRDSGIKLLKKIRSGGVDPGIRAEVWPFLLGVYDLNSSKEARDAIKNKNREEYEKLRRQCRRLRKQTHENGGPEETGKSCSNGDCESSSPEPGSPTSEDAVSARESLSSEKEFSENNSSTVLDRTSTCRLSTSSSPSIIDTDSSDSGSSNDDQANDVDPPFVECPSPTKSPLESNVCRTEDFTSWQRIIRLDALRANEEWIAYSPSQADIPEDRAHRSAEAVGLKDYDHLDPYRIYHAARLVAILEAYAIYDSEIGYCQGMSDLLSPIISVIKDDYMAFWCFVGFMKKARHNFRLDEIGIRRQLTTVGKIIKYKDSHLYKHLVKLQAEDCFFVYRMVVVMFRRELSFEQTLCLWEVMWTDQAAIRAGLGKSAWSRIRQRAPPTEDLLLYAIAASVLQRRKQIIEKYSSMDEILRECNNMAGQLDVWKLLDDAHDLVIMLHDKVDGCL
ncbi:rab GTPase-activating protein 22-like isoform X1 [Silene latifolia]|uniref:rab GTPase-activating protein 22-like isoform X1 n=1 Tax=Silene latifolia TaxID=37657 RepID=UPI003D777554